MNTKQLINKYSEIIAKLLAKHLKDIAPENLEFQILKDILDDTQTVVGTAWVPIDKLYYKKPDYQVRCDFVQGQYRLIYKQIGLKETQGIIATWKLYELPHCCAYMVSCNAFVEEEFRNLKVGTTLNLMRQAIGRLLGYSAVLCTDIAQNKHQRKLLAKNEWADIHTITNQRTGNTVFLCVKNL